MIGISKKIGLIIIAFIVLHIGLTILFGGVDYKGTLSTQYQRQDNSKTIITNHFSIETPKNWFHVFHGYGEEGGPFGFFFTSNGRVEYEYGIFSNEFTLDSIDVFSVETFVVNRFEVRVAHDDQDRTGIFIYKQHEMKYPFSFYMSTACTENLEEIISGIEEMKFQ
jgi:hypothetical protein